MDRLERLQKQNIKEAAKNRTPDHIMDVINSSHKKIMAKTLSEMTNIVGLLKTDPELLKSNITQKLFTNMNGVVSPNKRARMKLANEMEQMSYKKLMEFKYNNLDMWEILLECANS